MKLTYSSPSSSLKRWFWFLLLANIIFIVIATIFLFPLRFDEMVRLEVARKVPIAEGILQDWANTGKLVKAIPAVYLDFVFIPLYVAGLGAASLYLSGITGNEVLAKAGKVLPYLLILAGICDVIENFALLKVLRGHVTGFNVLLSYDMAAAKFTVIILSFLFALVCLIFWVSGKFSSRHPTL